LTNKSFKNLVKWSNLKGIHAYRQIYSLILAAVHGTPTNTSREADLHIKKDTGMPTWTMAHYNMSPSHLVFIVLLAIRGYHEQITLNQLQGVISGEWLDSEVETVGVDTNMYLDMM